MKGRLLFKVGFYLRSGTNCGITVFRIILCKIRIKDLFLFFANWWFFFVKSSSNSEFQTSKLFHIKLIHTFFTVFLWNRSSRFFMSNQIYLNLIVPPRFVLQILCGYKIKLSLDVFTQICSIPFMKNVCSDFSVKSICSYSLKFLIW